MGGGTQTGPSDSTDRESNVLERLKLLETLRALESPDAWETYSKTPPQGGPPAVDPSTPTIGSPRPALPHPAVNDPESYGVPPFAYAGALSAVTVPNPPELDPSDPPERRVGLLVRWYLGAWAKVTGGKTCWALRKPVRPGHKLFDRLLEGADALAEKRIVPAAWCLFSMAVWTGRIKPDTLPTIQWVFSAKRITNPATYGTYRGQTTETLGRTVVFTEAATELQARQESLRGRIRRASTDEDVAAAVAEILPRSLYDQLIARSQAQAKELAHDLRERARCGCWLETWG